MLAHFAAAAEFSCTVSQENCGVQAGEVQCPASPGGRSLRRISVTATQLAAGLPLELSLLDISADSTIDNPVDNVAGEP